MASQNNSVVRFSVSDFIALTNQTLEYAYPSVEVEGEVGSFKVNQGKFVFFDVKDAGGSVGCFMTVWQLRVPIEDGMKVIVTATPKLTPWGKFSLTVRTIRPSGEGAIKKSLEMLQAKLEKEGLFADERKRVLPLPPNRVAVISSTQSAGYADFIKIINDRWGGIQIDVAHVQVQGAAAPDQIIRALQYFNSQQELPDVIAIIRGGGSSDDLSAFNDEPLVREIASSRVPTLVGIGHEIDTSLADMVADRRAATPSNAAQILVPDATDVRRANRQLLKGVVPNIFRMIESQRREARMQLSLMLRITSENIEQQVNQLEHTRRLMNELDPSTVLSRGYALIRGDLNVGSMIEIEKHDILVKAEVKHVNKK